MESACATRTLSVFDGEAGDLTGSRMVMVISDHNGAFRPNEPIVVRFHRADATEETDTIQAIGLAQTIGTAGIGNESPVCCPRVRQARAFAKQLTFCGLQSTNTSL